MINDRFATLLLYVISRCAPHELGATKLNKALWFIDRESFILFGRTLSGRSYIKLENGPVPEGIGRALDELKTSGSIEERRVRLIEHSRREFEAKREPDMASFTREEIELVDEVVEFVRCRTAREVSDLSHDEAWESFELGEVIPIAVGSAAAFLAPISEEKLSWARRYEIR